MSDTQKAGQETLKNLNRQIILNYLRNNSETSRVDLAKLTKLSPTTVSAITSELVERNLVKEIRIGESNGGRKPLMLDINPNAKFVITAVVTQKGAEFSILDLNYHKVEQKYIAHAVEGPEAFADIMLSGLKEMVGSFRYNAEDICGLGISIPGVIDHRNGKVLYSSKLQLTDFDISAFIKENTGMKAYVFKDSDAWILGEFNAGTGGVYDSLAYVSIEDGVGMSYINSGKLFHPSVGGGFELGHITIDSNGPLCRCGNRGCLGAMVSEQPIVDKLKVLCEKGYETIIEGDVMNLSIADVVEYSNKGDKASRYVLEEQARILGTAIATVVNLFSPQLVLIGGPLSGCRWNFLEIMKDTVRDRALPIYTRNMDIKPARLGKESAQTGIASEIFAREIFKDVRL